MTAIVREPGTRRQVGVPAPRRDAREKLRGEAQFVGDMFMPRMLHGRVLRSTIAHGRIASIDTSAAE
jgi:CO/xanthine dehydrogenase Mo-binding subunit